jgi:hypothetical protein
MKDLTYRDIVALLYMHAYVSGRVGCGRGLEENGLLTERAYQIAVDMENEKEKTQS